VHGVTNDQGGGAIIWPDVGVSVTEKERESCKCGVRIPSTARPI